MNGYLQFSEHFGNAEDNIDAEEIGQKAKGLYSLDKNVVPPFFIIKASLFQLWLEDGETAIKVLSDAISIGADQLEIMGCRTFIIRSSAKHETFDERGFYDSSTGNISKENLLKNILQIWEQNKSSIEEYKDNRFAVIVQQYIKPKLSGHLSNERRVSRNRNEWLLECVNEKNEFTERESFIANEKRGQFTESSFNCTRKKQLVQALKIFANTMSERTHIEWVWDRIRIWIVQNDLEINLDKGTPPGKLWHRSKSIIDDKILSCFQNVHSNSKNWRKIRCLKTFIDCGLPTGKIFILEDSNVIDGLVINQLSDSLVEDLKWLLLYPIIIRMDILAADGYNNIMLPRTETLFTLEQAVGFLTQNAIRFSDEGLKSDEFCFLIHRFIISDSCSLAFSKPHLQKARIDSTWGIVEGLFFHPHDSFEVSLLSKTESIKKHIRCKTEYIDVDSEGKWFSKKGGTGYDWAESLTKKQILDIASYNVKIADYLDSPVTVMYFVGVDQSTGYPEILPWFYTTDEITESSIKYTDVVFSKNAYVIENAADFKKIKEEFEMREMSKIVLKLKLIPDVARDKILIESIGEFAKSKNIAIELEGSILAHTYYILRKLDVPVKCVGSFEPKYKRQKFYKLVRDKIPINIESKGERVRTVKIESNDLLNFLKEKAIEEAFEFYFENEEDKIIEELADIYEILKATCKVFGIKIDEVISIANKKNEKKGSFESGIMLLDTKESSLIDVIDTTGNSLLINEIDKKGEGRIKKKKIKKISFGTDNSITLPYVMNTGASDGHKISNSIVAPVVLHSIESIKILYTEKGIKITFIQDEKSEDTSQLSLFGN